MRSFKDKKGQEWTLDLTLGHVRQIEQSDFSVLKVESVPLLSRPEEAVFDLVPNRALSMACVWICVRDQAEARGVHSEEEFCLLLNATSINEACESFWGELSDFFPVLKMTLTKLIERFSKGVELLNKQAPEAVAETLTDEWMEQEIQRQLDQIKQGAQAKMAG
jgi:hypothetical protein